MLEKGGKQHQLSTDQNQGISITKKQDTPLDV